MDDSGRSTRVVLCVVGTRPEAVKMAPIVLRLKQSREARSPARLDRPASRIAGPGPGRFRPDAGPGPRLDEAGPEPGRGHGAGPLGSRCHAGLGEAGFGAGPGRYDDRSGLGTRLVLSSDSVWPCRGRAPDREPLPALSRGEEPGAGRPSGDGPLRPDATRPAQPAPRGDLRRCDSCHWEPRDRCPPDDRRATSGAAGSSLKRIG